MCQRSASKQESNKRAKSKTLQSCLWSQPRSKDFLAVQFDFDGTHDRDSDVRRLSRGIQLIWVELNLQFGPIPLKYGVWSGSRQVKWKSMEMKSCHVPSSGHSRHMTEVSWVLCFAKDELFRRAREWDHLRPKNSTKWGQEVSCQRKSVEKMSRKAIEGSEIVVNVEDRAREREFPSSRSG